MNYRELHHDNRMMPKEQPRGQNTSLTYSSLSISTLLFFFIVFTIITTPVFCWC